MNTANIQVTESVFTDDLTGDSPRRLSTYDEPWAILDRAWTAYEPGPSIVVGMYSGGYDSATCTHVTASWAAAHTIPFVALHIDTGTGIPANQQCVIDTCTHFGWPLAIYRAMDHVRKDGTPSPQDYAALVREHGFPGPFGHKKMYQRLKERQIDRFIRTMKHQYGKKSRIMLVSGKRTQESARRARTTMRDHERNGSRIWVNPIRHWSKDEVLDYRDTHAIPRNWVVDTLHRSGECNCLAPDTLVRTQQGWRTINTISEGDWIYNYTEQGLNLAPVATVHHNEPQAMINLKPYYLFPVQGTANHPVLIRDYRYQKHGRLISDEERWVTIGQIAGMYEGNRDVSSSKQRTCFVAYPFRTEQVTLGLSKAHLKLLGYFMAEGAFQYRKDDRRNKIAGIVFTIDAASRNMGVQIADSIRDIFACDVGWREYTDQRTGREFIMIRSGREEVSDFISRYIVGRYCEEKFFTDAVMIATLEEQQIILHAMWGGDGSEYDIDRGAHIEHISTYASSSQQLIIQVHELLLRMGRVYGLREALNDNSEYNTVPKPLYSVTRSSQGEARSAFIEGGVLWTAIQEIGDGGYQETWNLTIAGTPNYITTAGLVHNCGAFAQKGELDDIRTWFPETAAWIDALAQEARAQGFPWGWEDGPPAAWLAMQRGQTSLFGDYGADLDDLGSLPLCHSCDARFEAVQDAMKTFEEES